MISLLGTMSSQRDLFGGSKTEGEKPAQPEKTNENESDGDSDGDTQMISLPGWY